MLELPEGASAGRPAALEGRMSCEVTESAVAVVVVMGGWDEDGG